uniref:CD226 molecule n=1 Tax=Poecilia latipinna TaxID=48699 RepID=A0A3B3U0B5_9TELE
RWRWEPPEPVAEIPSQPVRHRGRAAEYSEITDVETVRLEEGMVLACVCPWDGQLSMVSWTKVPDKNPIAVFSPEFGVSVPYTYRERIEFLRTTPMDGSIALKNVTHQDIGLYHCSVQTFPQGPWTKDFQVEDLEEVTVDSEVVAEESSNLTVSCKHPHNGTIYQVILEKMPHGRPWVIIGICKKVEGGLVSEDYSERGRVNCADSLDLSLHLTDVASGDDGLYRCTFNTDVGVQTTVVQLRTAPPGTQSNTPDVKSAPQTDAVSFPMLIAICTNTLGVNAFERPLHFSFINQSAALLVKTCHVCLLPYSLLTSTTTSSQPNIYENVPLCPRIVKKSKQTKSFPIYANLPAGRSLQTKRQPQDKKRKGAL